MATDESTHTKSHLRKLAALRRYVGDELGELERLKKRRRTYLESRMRGLDWTMGWQNF